ncbi:ClpXP protease specificity-enhancing factor [Pelagibaculum spongiae]|uniref:ClpXP protease specificity-enhancing factor n=2 Tax=Pelagibaculum spongiae TaxID=2080658 RepID=A0A2V1H7W5_9GAMM|nr:ClpXP protease specificity-enhancing factor [Pelagibaculum spongiae]PVZ72592.1 ClpXP protease specificity-enhancing factor [Pelagibaculum spongiae]
MTPRRPYMLRAIYDWLLDNQCTPHLLVDAEQEGVVVPTQYVEGGQIVLNLAPTAVRGLELGDDEVGFSARFGGTPMQVRVPMSAVLAVYARENGQGMVFPEEYLQEGGEAEAEGLISEGELSVEKTETAPSASLSGLSSVKKAALEGVEAVESKSAVESVAKSTSQSSKAATAKPAEKKRPALRVVK